MMPLFVSPRGQAVRVSLLLVSPPWLAGRGQRGGNSLDDLGIRARLALRKYFLYQLER